MSLFIALLAATLILAIIVDYRAIRAVMALAGRMGKAVRRH